MKDKGIGSWTVRRARMAPHLTAITDAGRDWTYGEIEERSNRLAQALKARGVRAGDRVAYIGLNSVHFIESMFAAARIGAVTVPLNTRLAPPEVAYILRDCAPTLMIWDEPFAELISSPEVVDTQVEMISVRPAAAGTTLEDLVAEGTADPIDEAVSLDDLFMIQYTSGTSGHPKGVMLTHANVTWNVVNCLIDLDITSRAVALIVPPLFHTGALNQVLLPMFIKGGRCILHQGFDPGAVLDAIEAERVTFFFGVPAMFVALLQHPRWETADLTSIDLLTTGAAPMPESILRELEDRGFGTVQGYGLTEASPGLTMLRSADALRKLGSVGTPSFFTDVRLVGAGGGDVGPGGTGEILAEGPNLSPGYWQNPTATAAAFSDDGWLRTGDLGRYDDESYLSIVDRVKDMIISGGENIYPAEVEQAIHAHPAVAEVAVIGVPDERWGEVGRAVVTVRDDRSVTEAEILEFLDGRLARYKIPRSVVVVDELPHTASGKLVKRRVREQFGASTRGDQA